MYIRTAPVRLFEIGHPLLIHLSFSCGSCGRLVLEERPDTAASTAFAGVRMLGDDSAFRGLYEDPAGPLERYLERLAAAASGEGLEGDIAPYARPHTAAPGDGGLGVGEGWSTSVEENGLPVRGEGYFARAFEYDVEEAPLRGDPRLRPALCPSRCLVRRRGCCHR